VPYFVLKKIKNRYKITLAIYSIRGPIVYEYPRKEEFPPGLFNSNCSILASIINHFSHDLYRSNHINPDLS
jgi:hypothetical protein